MTDRELLELAAKAAGLNIVGMASKYICQGVTDHALIVSNDRGGDSVFDPLTDDGDALRLAVKLHICTLFPMHRDTFKQCGAGQVGGKNPACMEPYSPDPYAATRRAIVRAAAEIGRTK